MKRSKTARQRSFITPILLAALAFGVYLNKDTLLSQLDSKEAKKQRQISSNETPSSSTGKITLANFDKYKQKIFIDGQRKSVDLFKQVAIPQGKTVTLRIQTPGREHFVTTVKMEVGQEHKKVTIMETRPAFVGHLFSSSDCLSGNLKFTLFGEDREESLPLKNSIPFPFAKGNDGSPDFELTLLRKDGIKTKKMLKFQRNEEAVDICSLL